KAEKGVKDFAGENGIKYLLACVTKEDKPVEVVKRTKGVPTTLFIDRDGLVRAEAVGARDFEVLEGMAQALLDAKPGAGVKAGDAPKKDGKKADEKPF